MSTVEITGEENSLGSVQVSLSPIQRFEEYLQSRGQRNTEQRRFLVERVFSHHEHFDADQLMDQLPRKGSPNMSHDRPYIERSKSLSMPVCCVVSNSMGEASTSMIMDIHSTIISIAKNATSYLNFGLTSFRR